jgi:hypothetical protein
MAARKTAQPRDRRGRFMKRPTPVLLSPLMLQHLLYHTIPLERREPANILELAKPLQLVDGANMARTSFTPVGISAGSPEPSLRPSPATGHDAEILGVYDPDLGYDAEIFHISSPHGGLDLHFAQGYWEGYVATFPYTQ